MKKNELYIGCSSYTTASWQPLFYPENLPKKNWFDYYCRQFDTYEFNGSFYRFPTVSNLEQWYDKTPVGFKFSMKVPKMITHIKKMEDCDQEIGDFYTVVTHGVKDKLACVLWQFPPGFVYTEERLKSIVGKLNGNFKNIVEFRHQSWWSPQTLATLSEANITFCNPSYPGLPDKIIKNTSIGYFRFHGIPKLFYSEYPEKTIEAFYNDLMSKNFSEAYIYFNNTASAAGIINALQLLKIKYG